MGKTRCATATRSEWWHWLHRTGFSDWFYAAVIHAASTVLSDKEDQERRTYCFFYAQISMTLRSSIVTMGKVGLAILAMGVQENVITIAEAVHFIRSFHNEEPVVEKHGLTLIETALRWVHHHSALKMGNGGRDGILIGVSSFSQLETNLADVQKGPLPQEVVDALDKAWLVAKPYSPPYWHLDLKYTYNTQEALFKPKA